MDLIAEYIKSKANAWSDSTKTSEYWRLQRFPQNLDEDPQMVWGLLQDLSPYSRKTSWIRLCSFYDWLIEKGYKLGPNKFRQWMKDNARQFKYVYETKTPEIDYQQAKEAIIKIPSEAIRKKCYQLLEGGLRYSESTKIDGDVCIGKGGKQRTVFVKAVKEQPSYKSVYKALKKIGLKPHDLRKIKATYVARKGASVEDLCRIFGWSSLNTAINYLAPKTKERLKELMDE